MARLITPLFIGCVVVTPLLVPPVVRNAVPGDFINVAFILACAILLWRLDAPVRAPLAVGYILFLFGGLIALPNSASIPVSFVTLLQDVYLFLLFLAAANYLAHGKGRPEPIAMAWVVTGVAVAVLTWLSTSTLDAVSTVFGWPTVTMDGRAQATFRNPNLAANYLVVSLFILWAAPKPGRVWLKLLLSLPLLLGIVATYSITAIVALVAGAMAASSLSFITTDRRGRLPATLGLGAVALLLVVALSDLYLQHSRGTVPSAGRTQILSQSLGRADEAAADRFRRWQQAIDIFGDQILVGVGPAGATAALELIGVPMSGELHNDYLSAFVERGVVGGLGVICLFSAAIIRTIRLALDSGPNIAGWRPAALFGGVVTMLLSAMTLEVLHFRHLWLFLALALGVALQQGRGGIGGESGRTATPGLPAHPRSRSS